MTQSPNNMRPDLYPIENLVRRNNYVLPMMYEEGYITEAELQEYLATPVVTVGQTEEEYTEVVDYMLNGGEKFNPCINEEQYTALLENRVIVDDTVQSDGETQTISSGVSSYYIDTVIRDVVSDLMEENEWTEEYADNQLRSGGYRIYTCVDLDMQDYLEEKFCDWHTFSASQLTPNENGEIPEAAMVIMGL